jgi:hypothetical protein
MEAERTHDVLQTSPMRTAADPGLLPPPVMQDPSVVEPPTTYVPANTPVTVDEVTSTRRFSWPAVLAGALGVGMIVWGVIVMARAGLDGPFQDPVVSVAGLSANALSGAIVAGLGLLMLISALTASRSAIVFAAIITGIAAVVGIFEPDVGHGALDIERELPVIIAIGAGVVLLAVAVVPNMQRRVHRVERTAA